MKDESALFLLVVLGVLLGYSWGNGYLFLVAVYGITLGAVLGVWAYDIVVKAAIAKGLRG